MKTLKEMMKVMEHFDNGGKVEFKDKSIDGWNGDNSPDWNWAFYEYRIKQEPKTDWLKTGWVKEKAGAKYMITGYDEDNGQPYKIDGVWYSEEEMESLFDPCESQIGK